MRSAAFALAIAMIATPAAADTVLLHAAGSLKAALADVAAAYERTTGNMVTANYGASGLLKDAIVAGAAAQVFASANMEHPQALAAAGKAGPVRMFARNTMCALVKQGVQVDSASVLARMLDPKIKVGTSTPKADPSGDYAFEVFAKAERITAGAKAALEAKALKLTGNADSAKAPEGRNVYGWNVAEGRADIFLTYCTNALVAQAQNPGQHIVALPAALVVGADYGLTVLNGAPKAAQDFAGFILSKDGQAILARHGFAPPAQ